MHERAELVQSKKCIYMYLVRRVRLGRRDGELAGVEVPGPVAGAARDVGVGDRPRRRLLGEPPGADAPHGRTLPAAGQSVSRTDTPGARATCSASSSSSCIRRGRNGGAELVGSQV